MNIKKCENTQKKRTHYLNRWVLFFGFMILVTVTNRLIIYKIMSIEDSELIA